MGFKSLGTKMNSSLAFDKESMMSYMLHICKQDVASLSILEPMFGVTLDGKSCITLVELELRHGPSKGNPFS